MTRDSTVYLTSAALWLTAMIVCFAKDLWLPLPLFCAGMVLASLIWAHRAWHHEQFLRREAVRLGHPTNRKRN